jgi:H+-transporting ATPase
MEVRRVGRGPDHYRRFQLGLPPDQVQTLTLVTLVFGSQGLMYALRERGHVWRSTPGAWVIAASVVDVALVSTLALSGVLMAPLPGSVLVALFLAAAGFTLVLDQIKRPILSRLGVE